MEGFIIITTSSSNGCKQKQGTSLIPTPILVLFFTSSFKHGSTTHHGTLFSEFCAGKLPFCTEMVIILHSLALLRGEGGMSTSGPRNPSRSPPSFLMGSEKPKTKKSCSDEKRSSMLLSFPPREKGCDFKCTNMDFLASFLQKTFPVF